MSKGVIVQLDYDKAHILQNDGAFIARPREAAWQIGDVITTATHKRFGVKTALISCAAVFVLLFGIGAAVYQIPATYIEITVNPSVCVTLNRFDRVLSVAGLNEDGDKLIDGASYKHLTLNEAYARLFNRLDNGGYLTDAQIQLVIANGSQVKVGKIESELQALSEKYSQANGIHFYTKRYTSDEYLQLDHPLPIVDLPMLPATETPEQTAPAEQTPSPQPTAPQQRMPMHDNWHNGEWSDDGRCW